MAVHEPRLRQYVPPSPEERAARRAELEAWSAERERRHQTERPARLAAIRTGPTLRDLDAAADCPCGCHPRPAQIDLHDGGVRCVCQLTPEERATSHEELLASMKERWSGAEFESAAEACRRRLEEHANHLGVSADVRVEGAPFVIAGQVDGRGFYLRERHGQYHVTVASDDDPTADPWESPPEQPTLDIASGPEDELFNAEGEFDELVALDIAVDAVRTYLLRNSCDHDPPRDPEHRYCRRCGAQLR